MKKLSSVFLLLVGLLLLGSIGCGTQTTTTQSSAGQTAAQQRIKIDFALTYKPHSGNTDVYAALFKGFYSDAGLDVNIIAPGGAADSIKLVASGTVQIAEAMGPDVILARDQGVPILSVAALHQDDPIGMLSFAADNVMGPKNMKGQKTSIGPRPYELAFLTSVLKNQGLTVSDITIAPHNMSGTELLMQKEVQTTEALGWYEPILVGDLAKKEVRFWPYSDFGAPTHYGYTIITSEKFLQANQETVKKFVAATLKGLKWAQDNPVEAVDLLVKHFPELDKSFTLRSWQALIPATMSDDTKANGLGHMTLDNWQTVANFFYDNKLVNNKPEIAKIYSNDYLPSTPIQ
jgi:ABC-type nitrate/sulfonate/bicarbonate transport system substrate-binding protein